MSRNLLRRIVATPARLVGTVGLLIVFVGGVLFVASCQLEQMIDETFA